MKPLNGEKTHPLSAAAMDELRYIAAEPRPRSQVNPGVANRLLRGGLVESVALPSPFKTHGVRNCEHLQITNAGKEKIK